MLLTEKRLRAVIHDILLEGVVEDRVILLQDQLSKSGDHNAIDVFNSWLLPTGYPKPKWERWVKWLANRYLSKEIQENENLPDALSVIENFDSTGDAISKKYNENKKFRADVDASFGPPASRGWQNPSKIDKMSVGDLQRLMELYKESKQTYKVDRSDDSWKSDEIGKFGTWKLYFPLSRQNSIKIAGGYTTWCTARTSGENLFYSYVARGIMLFYAIDESKKPTNPESRISLGYVRGVLNVSGENGDVTVNAQNGGLVMSKLEEIFEDHLRGILDAAEAVVKHHGAKHPAKKEIDAAAEDPEKFTSMLHGLSNDESTDMAKIIISKYSRRTPSPEVLAVASKNKNSRIRSMVACRVGAPPEILTQLAGDADENVRFYVASNESAPDEVLIKLSDDESYTVKETIASRKAPVAALNKLAKDPDIDVRQKVASNEEAPREVIDMMAEMLTTSSIRGAHGIDSCLASHQNISAEALRKLYDHESKINDQGRKNHVLGLIASNKNVDAGTLDQIAKNSEAPGAWSHVAKNPNTEEGTLLYMAGNPAASDRIKIEVENNKNATEAVRLKLATDKDDTVRYYVARSAHVTPGVIRALYNTAKDMGKLGQLDGLASNHKTPPDVLEKLVDIPGIDMTQVIDNPNVTDEVLEKLASSNSKYARDAETMLFWRRERSKSRETWARLGESRNEGALRQARYIVSRLRRIAGET